MDPKDLLLYFVSRIENQDDIQLSDVLKNLPLLVIEIQKVGRLKKLTGEDKFKLLDSILRMFVNKFVTNQETKDLITTFIINDLSHVVSGLVFISKQGKYFKKSMFKCCKK